MLKPFFQGKLDTFCAIYAVLNALRLTHGIQTLKARDILNETLLSLAGKPGACGPCWSRTRTTCSWWTT